MNLPNDLARDAQFAREALPYVRHMAGDYGDWLRIGMSLTPLGSDGLPLWIDWSQNCPEKFTEGACERKWRTFGSKGTVDVTLGTLFHLAKTNGWPGQGRESDGPGRGKTEARKATVESSRDGEAHATTVPTVDQVNAERRVEIEVTTRRHEVLEQAVKVLPGDPDLFRRGEMLVTVVEEKADSIRLTCNTLLTNLLGSPRVMPLAESVVGCVLTRNASFYRMAPGKGGETSPVDIHPPDWLVKAVANLHHWPGVRPLLAVTECPYPRPDGSIVETAGYDPTSGTLYRPAIAFPPVPACPSQEDARAAWERLRQPIRQFPFASKDDEAVWLAGLLTAIARPAIQGPVPGVAFNGNKPSCCKGLSVDSIGILASGRCVPTSIYPDDKEEAGKVKVAIAISGKSIIHFDNLDEGSTYGNSGLDSALT